MQDIRFNKTPRHHHRHPLITKHGYKYDIKTGEAVPEDLNSDSRRCEGRGIKSDIAIGFTRSLAVYSGRRASTRSFPRVEQRLCSPREL